MKQFHNAVTESYHTSGRNQQANSAKNQTLSQGGIAMFKSVNLGVSLTMLLFVTIFSTMFSPAVRAQQIVIPNSRLKNQVKVLVNPLIKGTRLKWDHGVKMIMNNTDTYRVTLDFNVDVFGPDPSAIIKFDLQVLCNSTNKKIFFTVSNATARVHSSFFSLGRFKFVGKKILRKITSGFSIPALPKIPVPACPTILINPGTHDLKLVFRSGPRNRAKFSLVPNGRKNVGRQPNHELEVAGQVENKNQVIVGVGANVYKDNVVTLALGVMTIQPNGTLGQFKELRFGTMPNANLEAACHVATGEVVVGVGMRVANNNLTTLKLFGRRLDPRTGNLGQLHEYNCGSVPVIPHREAEWFAAGNNLITSIGVRVIDSNVSTLKFNIAQVVGRRFQSSQEQAATIGAGVQALSLQALSVSKSSQAVTFNINATGVTEAGVQVYGLDGSLIFDSGFQTGGHALSWNLLSNNGRQHVANGVYLYMVTLRGHDGKVIRSEVKKMIVLN